MYPYILRVCAVIAYLIYNISIFLLIRKVFNIEQKHPLIILGFSLYNTVALFMANTFHSPYFVTYIVGLVCLVFEFIIYCKITFKKAYLAAMLVMINIISIQTIVVGVLSSILNKQLVEITIQQDSFSLNIMLTFTINILIMILSNKLIKPEGFRSIAEDKAQCLSLSLVGTFMIAYSCFDSITMSYSGYYSNLANTIIAVQVMSILVFYVLLFHSVKISSFKPYKKNAEFLERAFEEKLKSEEMLKRLIFKDNLTGCYSKTYVMDYLDKLVETNTSFFSLIYIDIDNLKHVNDKYGHSEGDKYIIMVSKCISLSIRETDIFARMGGDEFLLVLEDSDPSKAEVVFERVKQLLSQKMLSENVPYKMSLCYGVTHVDSSSRLSKQEIIDIADKKMYQQKQLKKSETVSL